MISIVQNQSRNLKNNIKKAFCKQPYYYIVIHVSIQFLHVPAQRIYFYRLIPTKKVDFADTGHNSAQIRHFAQNQSQNALFMTFLLHIPL